MRLICTITPKDEQENPFGFSHYLASQGIENQCEEVVQEGKPAYNIWIFDEDQIKEAKTHYETYLTSPQDAKFHVSSTNMSSEEDDLGLLNEEEPTSYQPPQRRSLLSSSPYGAISVLIIFAAIGLFIWSQFQRENVIPPNIPGVIGAPVLSPIERLLIFDYPTYFVLRDKLLTVYTPQNIKDQKPPNREARALLRKIYVTPVWMGLYDRTVDHLRKQEKQIVYSGPFAGDVTQGEVWRLFTPALLHFDFLHIFFNLLWFIILGNQIEYRIGSLRYLLMILGIAAISNIGQYLASGPFFMGLSGVVCGLAAFIWARQQVAPWEGYLLHRFTLIFLGIFIVGMFLLQVLFFFLQVFGKLELTIGIANTAHLTGAAVGYGCGRMRRLFAIKKKVDISDG